MLIKIHASKIQTGCFRDMKSVKIKFRISKPCLRNSKRRFLHTQTCDQAPQSFIDRHVSVMLLTLRNLTISFWNMGSLIHSFDGHLMPVCVLECRNFQCLLVTLQLFLLWKGSCWYKLYSESLCGVEAVYHSLLDHSSGKLRLTVFLWQRQQVRLSQKFGTINIKCMEYGYLAKLYWFYFKVR